MRYQRLLVLPLLIYVTLDLSIPAMPGAFVFEYEDSAESIRVRGRAAAETAAIPPGLAGDPGFVLSQPPREVGERLAPVSWAERRARPADSWRPRAHCDSAPPSEDPH